MDLPIACAYLAFGFVGAAFGGMVGSSGASFTIPLIALVLAPDTQQLRAAAMVSNMCVAAGAALPYARAGQIDWTIVRRVAPWAVLMVAAGVWISVGIDTVLYRALLGTFVLMMVAREFRLLIVPPAVDAPERPLSTPIAICTGGAAGVAAGVLCVGGGVVFLPVLREWLRVPVKRAAATSLAMVLPSVTVGALAQMWSMSTSPHPQGGTLLPGALSIAACMAPAALVGGWVGARLNVRLSRTTVAWVMTTALTVAAILLLRPMIVRLAPWISPP